ncbi:S-adenosyl-L-methionine-dependent methyltransferase [Pilobolus umbonatus]|nr:S-adenosyl-L-methionine-dependent methyltransferase [Pilobolus umbonatus]
MSFLAFLNLFRKKDTKSKDSSKQNSDMSESGTSSSQSAPTSKSSEGRNHQYIDGRRFNNEEDVQYLLPNDNDEADRLHQQHWVIRYAFQSNYHAPIKKKLQQGISVLDSGCGPATWIFDMAEVYPNSTFTGIDISFVFPESVKPPNVDLRICNTSKELPFEDNSFDFYFQRLLLFGLTRTDWQNTLKNAYRVLKPGAYIELVEPNMEFYRMGPCLTEIQNAMSSVMAKRDMMANLGGNLESLLQEAGFENIHVQIKPLPMNHTNKVGDLWWQDLLHAYSNIRPMMALANAAFEDVDVYNSHLKTAGEECASMKTNSIFYIAYAQKPE